MRCVVTDIGRSIRTRVELGEITMSLTEVRVGNGIYHSTDTLVEQTALRSEKNTYPINSIRRIGVGGTISGMSITSVISNFNADDQSVIDEDYRLNEVGLYVTVEGVKHLYMLAVEDEDAGQLLPVYTGTNAISYVKRMFLNLSNVANVTLNVSGAYALVEDIQKMTGEVEAQTTISADGKTVTEVTDMGTKVTVFNDDGSCTETFPDGKVYNTVISADGKSITKTEVL